MKYAVIDIETSGFSGLFNRITEISVFITDGIQVLDEYTSLVNPHCKIPYSITRLTGIDNSMVDEAPDFSEIADKIDEITQGCVFVAHNVNFDYSFVEREFREAGKSFKRKKLCSVRYAKSVFPDHQSYSLGNICRDLGIQITDRHRARGDAEATVELLRRCLKKDANKTELNKMLNPRLRGATLPTNIDFELFNSLPECPGVYHFLNKSGKVIYVGKALNIKQRVTSHFTSKAAKSINMKLEIADIRCQLSGNELLSFLMETHDIKRYYPKYNSAQKRYTKLLNLAVYENQKGILQLGVLVGRPREPYIQFTNRSAAYRFIQDFIDEYELCIHQQAMQPLKKNAEVINHDACRGVCAGKESVKDYNERVRDALNQQKPNLDQEFIVLEGRTEDEKAVVQLENGIYAGYGFMSMEIEEEEYANFIQPQINDPDTQSIVLGYLQRHHLQDEMEKVQLEPN
ncbi:exonuclease domain-containing protein [Luteibaculum oceani]|uniref:DNA polymerase III subunit epsilon n=1 Tax=Luteibaculum oceani TaxID=1294296 RepID=A0A5C6VFI5_9FLAO|nr:exonuclease domain-containing protein [Luteibaculum oceani]TXC82108.1 DNA polymerase III subunit epsilon [Luteibaculum oceani]